ncbi:uncharacterized protein [Branchiostoma lanceolatum]|uniref:uncharacterized protein isoform X2 n=1 Tax=Branchiostoma lanceolatum TaxID=7740 RepID=UPI0034562813
MACSSDMPKGKRRNKNRSLAARGLLYAELGYINSLTPKTAAAVSEVCLTDGLQLEDILMGHYQGRGVSRAAVEAARKTLQCGEGDPNLRECSPDEKHNISKQAARDIKTPASHICREEPQDLLSCSDGENMSVVTSSGQFTSGQTPAGDRSVLIHCEEPQSSQRVTSLVEGDTKTETVDLATTTDSQEQPLPCLPLECQSPVNTPKSSSPATEVLLTPVYDNACAHHPDHPSCAEEPPPPKCTSVAFRAKHSPRHVPYYTCQSPAGTPSSTPRLAVEGLWVHEHVQSLAKRTKEEDIADWVSGMCGTGEDIQGLAKKVDEEDTQDFVNETCGDQTTPSALLQQNVRSLGKKIEKEGIQNFVNSDQSTPTKLMYQDKDLQGISKEVDKEDPQDFSISKICGDRVTPTTHKGEDVNDAVLVKVKENPQDLVQTTTASLSQQDVQGLGKEEQDTSVITGMCGASHQMVPTTLTGQDEDIQAKAVDKEDQESLATEKHLKAQTDEPKKRGGKWCDLRTERERMARDRTDGINNDKMDEKKGRKWWRRVFTRKSGGKTRGSDSDKKDAKEGRKWWRRVFTRKRGGKTSGSDSGKRRGWCICCM